MAGRAGARYASLDMWSRWACLAAALILVAPAAHARPGRGDVVDAVLETVRAHRRALEEALPRNERDVQATTASLDRRSTLYARNLISRAELAAAAREAGDARARLEATRSALARTDVLIVEIEARRRLARLPALRPGQYDDRAGFLRYAGTRSFSATGMRALERYFTERIGRALPVSAAGQTDVHRRLGLDHRDAVDLALHPDSVEGRLVVAWLRAQGFSFLAFRGAQAGAATGAHIHVGPPSERIVSVTAASPAAAGVR